MCNLVMHGRCFVHIFVLLWVGSYAWAAMVHVGQIINVMVTEFDKLHEHFKFEGKRLPFAFIDTNKVEFLTIIKYWGCAGYNIFTNFHIVQLTLKQKKKLKHKLKSNLPSDSWLGRFLWGVTTNFFPTPSPSKLPLKQ